MKFKDIRKVIRNSRRQSAIEKELLQALSYIRNTVIHGRGKNISAEYLMEELSTSCTVLKPAFQDMSHYLHLWDKDKAALVLYTYMHTGFSKDLGRFLAGWEDIPPGELLGTLDIYMESLRDEYRGKKQKREEVLSDMIYLPVVLNAMLVLLDFLYVAFILEQQSLFTLFSR